MAGRNDYGVLHSELLADARAHRAAELYTERLGVPEAFALSSVVGNHTELGLWAMRETDDGVLPGDGVAALQMATLMPRSSCRQVAEIFTEVGLLVRRDAGLEIDGFLAAYASVLSRRAQNRDAASRARAEAARRRAAEDAARAAAPLRRKKGHRPGAQRDASPTPSATQHEDPPSSPTPTPHVAATSAPRHADVADQRIGSVRIEELPPTPSPAEADDPRSDAPSPGVGPLTPSEHAAARVIASALSCGEVRVPDTPELENLRRELEALEKRRLEAWRNGAANLAELEREAKALGGRLATERRARRERAVAGLRSGDGRWRPLLEDLRCSEALTGPPAARVPLRAACARAAAEARAAVREQGRAARALEATGAA